MQCFGVHLHPLKTQAVIQSINQIKTDSREYLEL